MSSTAEHSLRQGPGRHKRHRPNGALVGTLALVLVELLVGQPVQAQGSSACEGLRQAVIRLEASYSVMSVQRARGDIRDRVRAPSDLYGESGCPPGTERYFRNPVRSDSSPDFKVAVRDWGACAAAFADGRGRGTNEGAHYRYLACEAQVWSAELGGGANVSTGGRPVTRVPTTPPSQSSANRQETGARESPSSPDATLQAEVQRSLQIAAQRQQSVDRARGNKRKEHIVAREAHNCLRPQTGGGVINDCPYAVEYSYCVLNPERNSWSESFRCGQSMGSWQVGPGPNARSIMHTAGLTTYWFACRYGETLSKPDGVSPVDLEYQAGRGILGRCSAWRS